MMKWFNRFYEWLHWNWVPIIIGFVFLGIVIIAIHESKREYIKVPLEFCRSHYTGNIRTVDVPIYSCASFDRSGICTVPITTWTQHTDREVRTTCDFVSWE